MASSFALGELALDKRLEYGPEMASNSDQRNPKINQIRAIVLGTEWSGQIPPKS